MGTLQVLTPSIQPSVQVSAPKPQADSEKIQDSEKAEKQIYYKPSAGRQAGSIAVGAGIALSPALMIAKSNLTPKTTEQIKEAANGLAQIMPDVDTFENTKKYAEDLLKEKGLDKKGLKLYFVNENNSAELKEQLVKAMKGSKNGKTMAENYIKMFEHGANAAFLSKPINAIAVSENKAFTSIFHEFGHAHNYHFSPVMRAFQKARVLTPMGGIPIYGIGLFLATLFHKPKPKKDVNKNPVEKNGWDKTKDFFKKYAGTITFATFIPMLIEEGVASKKGLEFAKKYLDADKLKKLKMGYKNAWMTYGATAAFFGGLVGVANIIATKIQESGPKPKKPKQPKAEAAAA